MSDLNGSIREIAATFIRESNLIEEIDVPYEKVLTALKLNESEGHVGALLYLDHKAITQKYLNEQDICHCQELIIREQNAFGCAEPIASPHIGFYRDCDVFVGGKMGFPPKTVPSAMKQLLEDVHTFQKNKLKDHRQEISEVLDYAAGVHFAFETIHPFVDGNGRTGRLLVWFLLRFEGLHPFVFTDHDKFYTYYLAFNAESASDMAKYFRRRYKP